MYIDFLKAFDAANHTATFSGILFHTRDTTGFIYHLTHMTPHNACNTNYLTEECVMDPGCSSGIEPWPTLSSVILEWLTRTSHNVIAAFPVDCSRCNFLRKGINAFSHLCSVNINKITRFIARTRK